MNYTPQRITDDGSQLVVTSDVGQLAIDLATFDTPEKVEAEILRLIAVASPKASNTGIAALVGKQVTVSDAEIAAERDRQAAEAAAKAVSEVEPLEDSAAVV